MKVSNDIQLIFPGLPPQPDKNRVYLERCQHWLAAVAASDETLAPRHWLLSADTEEESHRYAAFDGDAPAVGALAVNRQLRKKHDIDGEGFGIWNGAEGQDQAMIDVADWTMADSNRKSQCTINLRDMDGQCRLGGVAGTIEAMRFAIDLWRPSIAFFEPFKYDRQKVFKDRAGAGWMLYLPRVISRKQLPEAGELVPILDGKTPLGTLIVSVADAVFSTNNPEHVRVAKAVEVRLVDQDLLPTFQQIQNAPSAPGGTR